MAFHFSSSLASIVISIWCLLAQSHVRATDYTVGDGDGWTIGINYLRWSEKYNFTVGDVLVFSYVPGQHNVYQVTETTFRSCNTSSGVINMYESGEDRVTLTEATKYWFICTVSLHCQDGMKFGINVANASIIAEPGTTEFGAPPPPGNWATGGGMGWWWSGWLFGLTLVLMNLS